MPGADCDKDVYTIPVFTPSFCDSLKSHILKYRSFTSTHGGSGNKNVDLRHVPGLSFVDSFLFEFVLKPLSVSLFPRFGVLNWHQSYAALYQSVGEVRRTSLDLHTDDSEVTGNLCIDDDFTGGDLMISGNRGDTTGYSDPFSLSKGVLILHKGRTFHGVEECEGRRETIITWGRNEIWRENVCPCCFYKGEYGEGCLCN